MFSLGCLVHFVCTAGAHPFGATVEAQAAGVGDAAVQPQLRPEEAGRECAHLVRCLLQRPVGAPVDATTALTHPFFVAAKDLVARAAELTDKLEGFVALIKDLQKKRVVEDLLLLAF